jgi:hypothetical protein
MGESSRIGCLVCARPIVLDDEAIELLSTMAFKSKTPEGEPDLFAARPAYVHRACGVPDGDSEVRHGLMRELRPPD